MYKLVTIGGHGGLAEAKKGAFFNTLEEYHKYWERIDVICPKPRGPVAPRSQGARLLSARPGGPPVAPPLVFFENVFLHCSNWPILFQPVHIYRQLKKLSAEGIDLIVVQEYPPFYNTLGLLLARRHIKNTPIAYEILHVVGYPRAADLKEKVYFILNRIFLPFILRIPRMIRVMNQEVRDFLAKIGVRGDKIKIVNAFYIDFSVFYPRQSAKEYDFIFTARLVKNKGLDILIKTAQKIKKVIPEFKFLIIGEGPEKMNLESGIRRYGLEESIILYGWARDSDEVAGLMNKSKVFLMTSYNEGGPRSTIEAMACGVPVISTRVGMMNEVIRDGENGFLVGWDAEEVALKAVGLLLDSGLQEKFSKNGIKTVAGFEKSRMIKNYFQTYENLIKNENSS